MAIYTLDFEKPLLELEKQIEELKRIAGEKPDVAKSIRPLEDQLAALRLEIYKHLTPMQRVQVARHPRRPYPLDYVNTVFTDFVELHGDRLYRDDPAIVGGWARLDGTSVMVIGHQKGRDTKENLYRNFGMAHPEGYRKAMRLMRLAAKFGAPVITLVDTPGAYPGLGAEERGQAEAIASSLIEMASLHTPIITAVIGEGGSGGALAVGLADRVLMLENSVYSVISPEGCAAILWKDASQRERAAEALKITAQDLLNLGVIDEIIPEPPGGAHSDPEAAAAALGDARGSEDGHGPATQRRRGPPHRTRSRAAAQSPDEGLRRRMAMGQAEAHDLFHRRAAGGLPGAGARPRGSVSHAHRAAADRRARRGEASRRDRALRPSALHLELAAGRQAGQPVAREGARAFAQPGADLGSVRPPALLPALRA